MTNEPFMNARDVAQIFGLKPCRSYEMAAAGDLPTVRFGRRVRFVRAGIEALQREAVERAMARQGFR